MFEQGAKNPLAAEFFHDIDALNPPEIPVAPIAPFVSDQQLAGSHPVTFGNEVNALGRILQQRHHARCHARRLEPQLLGFQRQTHIAIGDERGVGDFCLADLRFDGAMLTRLIWESILSLCCG